MSDHGLPEGVSSYEYFGFSGWWDEREYYHSDSTGDAKFAVKDAKAGWEARGGDLRSVNDLELPDTEYGMYRKSMK